MPAEGVFHNLILVSIRKSYPRARPQGDARHLGPGPGDVQQSASSWWMRTWTFRTSARWPGSALNNIDPERDIQFVMGPVDSLDHASRLPNLRVEDGRRRHAQVERGRLRAALARCDPHVRGRPQTRRRSLEKSRPLMHSLPNEHAHNGARRTLCAPLRSRFGRADSEPRASASGFIANTLGAEFNASGSTPSA